MSKKSSLSYLITVSTKHFMPAQMLLLTLTNKTDNPIIVVGNLNTYQKKLIKAFDVTYIEEDKIDYAGRLPKVSWKEKYRPFGWYKQMFIRLSIDRYIDTDQVVILDSEVFMLDNWDEERLYDPKTKQPRNFYWVPEKRKSDWDYKMYKGAAYLLSFLPGFEDVMEYADSDTYKRHISGVVLFSTKNIEHLWKKLESETKLKQNIKILFNKRKELAFSDHDIHGIAVDYGLFDKVVPTTPYNGLLGWYDNHTDKDFLRFQKNAMWSMCQQFQDYPTPTDYKNFMLDMAKTLKQPVTIGDDQSYIDADLVDAKYANKKDHTYFLKYKKQLDHSERKRFKTMYGAIKHLQSIDKPVIVEVGTLRDTNQGGGHSTYKFGEYCAKFGGELHTIDILKEAIDHSIKYTTNFQPWINYVVSDSTKYLEKFDKKIDFLYLDGFDSTPGKEKEAAKKQLEEMKAVLPKMADNCIILLDDADLPKKGKVRLSSKYLLKNGFKLVEAGYQQLYIRDGVRKKKKLFGKLKSALGAKS